MKKILVIVISLVLHTAMYSQFMTNLASNTYISPSVTIGYTFRCGWNYGIDLTLGLSKFQNTLPPTNLAMNLQLYVINYSGEHHNIIAFNIVSDNRYSQFGLGIGAISKKWGYKSVNKDAALGLSLIMNVNTGNYHIPRVGARFFIPSPKWTWSSLPYYMSFYMFWPQQPIKLK